MQIYHKYREQQVFKNVWIQKKYQSEFNGTNLLKDILGYSRFDYPKSIYAVEDVIKMASPSNGTVLDYFGGSGTTVHAVMNLNRDSGGNRKYILVEMGAHFDAVIKPRVQKISYSSGWKKGKPIPDSASCSHIVKLLKLESYEDTLNNLQLKDRNFKADLFQNLHSQLQEDYLINYMLDVETKGSLLSIGDFQKPFSYQMDISADSAGATEHTTVDLVETFNYLVGLAVKTVQACTQGGYALVSGSLPDNQNALIIWRDCDKYGYEELEQIVPDLTGYDVVYINGDHNLTDKNIRQIEPEFLDLMFAEEA